LALWRFVRASLWAYISNIQAIGYESDTGTKTANSFEEKCIAFLTTLFPDQQPSLQAQQPSLQVQQPSLQVQQPSLQKQWQWPDLEDSEVRKAIFTPSTKKAPGPDRINFILLRKAYTISPEVFNLLYKALFKQGYHPKCWREAIGITLPKPGKPNYTIPKAYRVIALLNASGKVLERIYSVRLGYLAQTTDLLHSSQLGGRKQRSAIDTVLLLLHNIQQQQQKSKGAFDNVSKAQLLQVIQDLNLPLYNWVSWFMTDRKIKLAFNGQIQQQSANISIGIPQGSPISPILFLLYVRKKVADRGL
jgi:hypothetical protein